jgi:uncharacterized protein
MKTLSISRSLLCLALAGCAQNAIAQNAIAQTPIAQTQIAQAEIAQNTPAPKMLRILSVTGNGKELIPTTLSQVSLGVEAQGKTANEVQEAVARRANAVVTLLKARRVDKLTTTGVNLNPNYNYDNGKQTLTGYTAVTSVSFRLPIDQVGTLLDEAVKAGASRIDGVSFVATDEAIAAARKQAIRQATQDAQDQANAALGALGFGVKEIVGIQVNGASAPPVRPQFEATTKLVGNMAFAPPLPVMGGEQVVTADITLQISY